MPNFHMHWLVALEAAESFPEGDDILLGKKKYLDYHKTFRDYVYNAIKSAKSMAGFRAAFKEAAKKLHNNLHRPTDYDAITCFSAYMLGACGPDFWTLMSKESGIPSADYTAGIHFDFGHYNRTHHQFTISGNRLRASQQWTLSQRAERAYFSGMATHFAADLVMHELVNVYAGAYNILEHCWENEHGQSAIFKNLWSTHNKVEHYWDTYVRYRWLGDWGTVWSPDEAPGGPARLGFPLADTIFRDAKNLNRGMGEEIGKFFMGNASLQIGLDLAGPLYTTKKEKRDSFDSNARYLLERGIIFPRIFCDRILAHDPTIDPFIYDVVVERNGGAYPSTDVFAEAIKEKTSAQMNDPVRGNLNETNKLKTFSSRTNLGDDFNSFNFQIHFMCPELFRLKKYGPTVFWEPKALIPFFTAAVQVASRFAGIFTSYAQGQDENIGALGKFWNLDTGLGVEVKNVAGASNYEVRTRIRLPHVTEVTSTRIGHQRADTYLGKKDKQDYDLAKKYSFKPDKPAFAVMDGPTVATSADIVESSTEYYLRALKTQKETSEPPREMSLDLFWAVPPVPRPQASLLVSTAQIQAENVVVRPRPLSTRLSLEFDVPMVLLGDKEETGFALYSDHAGASAAPQKQAEHAAKEWLAASKSQCMRFIDHKQAGDADDVKVDGERVRFTGRVLANLDPAWANAKREIAANQWNNVIDPSEVKKYCGHNIAVATCRKNVLKQHGDGEFWADSDFQLWQDLCPTEQVFFTIFALVRGQDAVYDVFTNQKIPKSDFEAIRKIRCVGFVPIVLLYVCDATGRVELDSCTIDGLPAPVQPIAAEEPVSGPMQFSARFVDERGEAITGFAGTFSHESDADRDMPFSSSDFAHIDEVRGAQSAQLTLPDDAITDLVDELKKRWKGIRGKPDDAWKEKEEALVEVEFKQGELSPLGLEPDTKQTFMLQPPVALARLHGMYFDTNKCFLVPTATASLRRLLKIYEKYPDSEILIVGHTDTAGKEGYNLQLSADRADAFKAYLSDDADAWLDWYMDDIATSKRWGEHEDTMMIEALVPEDELDEDDEVTAYQEWHNGESPDARQPQLPRSQPEGWEELKVDMARRSTRTRGSSPMGAAKPTLSSPWRGTSMTTHKTARTLTSTAAWRSSSSARHLGFCPRCPAWPRVRPLTRQPRRPRARSSIPSGEFAPATATP